MKIISRTCISAVAAVAMVFGLLPLSPANAAITRHILFPVIGPTSFSDDFGAPRVGHTHEGNDVFGTKGQPLVAAVDGVVEWIMTPERGNGLGFSIRDAEGYSYWYLHVNNDTPGTDDGASRGIFAYAPDLYGGNTVVAGQLLGWLGDSGNAESTHPHLHFEIHAPDRQATDPFLSLTAAHHITKAVVGPAQDNELLPYAQFTGGASIAIGELDHSSPGLEIVTGAGPGGGPHVRVFGEDHHLISQFSAFETSYRGGIDVATGDVDGDGTDEIIVAAGRDRAPEVRVFSTNGVERGRFYAYARTFLRGLHVTAADLTGDGRAEIITGPLRGGGPQIRVFDGMDFHVLHQFSAYADTFRGGVDVAAYPATATTPSLIVTTPLQGGGPQVRVFNGIDHSVYASFSAREPENRAGMRVAVANVYTSTPEPEIVVVPETKGYPRAIVLDLAGNVLANPHFLEPWWQSGYDVAAEPGGILAVTATPSETRRRTTVRWVYGPLMNFRFGYGGQYPLR